ncbi:MAG: hypothetical protein DRJ37_07310 [Thermoprotei archaeon]|nr:MAG: hypothetical protein DRJ37_07310 [Thermoprotei archaeon]
MTSSFPGKEEVLLNILVMIARYRGRGVGTALINYIIDLAKR